MQRLEDVESEEYAAALNQLKEEIQAGIVQVRSAVERSNRLAELLESQKQELAAIKQITAKQALEISQLKAKLSHQQLAQDTTSKEVQIPDSPVRTIPRSLSFSAIKPVVSKNEPAVKPRSGSDLTRFSSSLFLFKNLLKSSSPRDEVVHKVEKEISPRVNFLNPNLRAEVSPRKERPAEAKEKNHANDEMPITKDSLYRLYSASRGTGNGGFKTLDKEKTPYHYTEYMNVHTLVKRNLTK